MITERTYLLYTGPSKEHLLCARCCLLFICIGIILGMIITTLLIFNLPCVGYVNQENEYNYQFCSLVIENGTCYRSPTYEFIECGNIFNNDSVKATKNSYGFPIHINGTSIVYSFPDYGICSIPGLPILMKRHKYCM